MGLTGPTLNRRKAARAAASLGSAGSPASCTEDDSVEAAGPG